MVITISKPGIKSQRTGIASTVPKKDFVVIGVPHNNQRQDSVAEAEDAEIDVIDLGAPRRRRRPTPAATLTPRLPRPYAPNSRLYPGKKEERHKKRRTAKATHRRKFTSTAPNPRLYKRAPPPPPPPPPARPHAAWPAPPRGALDTASRAALRLHEQRAPSSARNPTMATGKHSTSPDCSDGNDASSAPSEFLAEFLSAIMRRQYAEALKYCQLILQYEPHNATAQGFYPLLRHKLHAHAHDETSSSDDTSSKRGALFHAHFRKGTETKDRTEEVEDVGEVGMEQGSSRSGSVCSSLELDSSASPPPSPPPPRSDRTDHSDSSSWRWESGGERSERDDNGNPALCAEEAAGVSDTADADNDNTTNALQHMCTKGEAEASPLRMLRARFACSIK